MTEHHHRYNTFSHSHSGNNGDERHRQRLSSEEEDGTIFQDRWSATAVNQSRRRGTYPPHRRQGALHPEYDSAWDHRVNYWLDESLVIGESHGNGIPRGLGPTSATSLYTHILQDGECISRLYETITDATSTDTMDVPSGEYGFDARIGTYPAIRVSGYLTLESDDRAPAAQQDSGVEPGDYVHRSNLLSTSLMSGRFYLNLDTHIGVMGTPLQDVCHALGIQSMSDYFLYFHPLVVLSAMQGLETIPSSLAGHDTGYLNPHAPVNDHDRQQQNEEVPQAVVFKRVDPQTGRSTVIFNYVHLPRLIGLVSRDERLAKAARLEVLRNLVILDIRTQRLMASGPPSRADPQHTP